MDARPLARQHAFGRVLVGAGLALAPRLAGSGWMGRDSRRPATQVAIRALGARDLVIGLGTAYTAGQGFGARPWVLAGIVGLVAGGSTQFGLWLSRELD